MPDDPALRHPDSTAASSTQRLDLVTRRPYTHREYAARIAWRVVQSTLFRFSPRLLPGWRNVLLRLFGGTLGSRVLVHQTVRITHPWLLTLGDRVAIGEGAILYNLGPLLIKHDTVVSQRAHLCGGTHDHTQPGLPLIRTPITLGSSVWVCAEAFIGPGVTVGDGSVVAARAVVTRDVADNIIVAGNPSQVVKQRVIGEKRVVSS